ncbi:sulfite exporter TauE/SafE family protein [Niabella beijingensis]|uniref:sulfite exporter TauE/SafE family protein n=1 Tax=Niabella beijingensis TaxID=2872700 RepID=UPI001CBF6D3C|nr:sulfite exporter TauE/SafE family protein [Niabella beijingensis]MBZ4191064.1 sulfite exporter TauE/SafE family protein [Niabella beijingensis]
MWEALLAGWGIGMAGSLHCVGMCGPLALSLPLQGGTRAARLLSILFYNLGRTVTYFTMGLVLGWAGRRLLFTGYQQFFSIALGVLLLVLLLCSRYLPQVTFFSGVQLYIKQTLARFLMRKNHTAMFLVIGMLNGLLPCGLVYMAVTTALLSGGPVQAGLLMTAFGLGTLPLMALLMLTGHRLSLPLRSRLKKAVPFFIAGVAILMVLRGLNLGVPYISPAFSGETAGLEIMECHPAR